jgi:hypothetical protein
MLLRPANANIALSKFTSVISLETDFLTRNQEFHSKRVRVLDMTMEAFPDSGDYMLEDDSRVHN